jgi:hypothetical protein
MSLREGTRPGLGITTIRRPVMFLIMAAGALAGCSGFGNNQQATAADPNVFPTNYRSTLVKFLRVSLTNRSDFRAVTIAEPALKPVGTSQHYVVCIQFNPPGQTKTTMAAVYLSGQMTQFIDATPEQCADAVYQPFKELDAATPPETLPTNDLSNALHTY